MTAGLLTLLLAGRALLALLLPDRALLALLPCGLVAFIVVELVVTFVGHWGILLQGIPSK